MSSVFEKTYRVLFSLLILSMPLSMAGMEIFSSTLLLVWFVDMVVHRKELKGADYKMPGWPLLLIYGAMVIYGALTAAHFDKAQTIAVVGDARLLIFVFMYYDLFRRQRVQLQHLILPAFVALFAVFSFGIYQFFTGSDPFRDVEYLSSFKFGEHRFWRVKGFFSTPMTFGNTMALWFILFVSLFVGGWPYLKKKPVLLWTLIVISSLCFVFSFVRGAWVGAFATLLVMTFVRRRKWILPVFAVQCFLVLGAYYAVPPIQKKIDMTLSGKDTSINDRLLIWKYYVGLFKERPLLGAGHRFTGELMAREKIMSTANKRLLLQEHAHSNFLQVLAGLGIIGFIGFYGFFLHIFVLSWKTITQKKWQSETQILLFAAMMTTICFHLSSFSEATLLDWEVVHMFCFFMGMTLACYQLDVSNRPALKT